MRPLAPLALLGLGRRGLRARHRIHQVFPAIFSKLAVSCNPQSSFERLLPNLELLLAVRAFDIDLRNASLF